MTEQTASDFAAIIGGCDETGDCTAPRHSSRCWRGQHAATAPAEHIDPDCKSDKHPACPGWTFAEDLDRATPCECPCHAPETSTEH